MLGNRLRRRPDNKTTLVVYIVFAGIARTGADMPKALTISLISKEPPGESKRRYHISMIM